MTAQVIRFPLPPRSPDYLSNLRMLETQYDGSIPQAALQVAQYGSAEAVEYLFAVGQMEFFRRMAFQQIEVIRMRRESKTAYPTLVADLRLYRVEWHDWRRRAVEAKAKWEAVR